MEGFLAIIVIIFAVFQFILFFKIWEMTNNVKKLTEHFAGSLNNIGIMDKVRLAKLQGQSQDQIQKFLADSMASEIIKAFKNPHGYGVAYTVEGWNKIFQNAGIEMPDNLKQIKTEEDVINLYHEKEWDEVLNDKK